jgi:hypothetical protein
MLRTSHVAFNGLCYPCRVQIPLMLSMRITMNVKNICVWASKGTVVRDGLAKCSARAPEQMQKRPDDGFFRLPEGYRTVTMEQCMKEKHSRNVKARQARLQKESATHAMGPSCSTDTGGTLRHRTNGKVHTGSNCVHATVCML